MRRLLIFILLLCCIISAHSQSVTLTGSTWTVSAPTTLVTQSGKNYETNETSAANQTLVNMTGLLLTGLSVRQIVGANWDSSLQIWVRRTGNGTGLAIPVGGAAFQQITATNASFFTVLLPALGGTQGSIPLQYELRGFSVLLPVKTYTTTIQYTISGL